jgi:outer membrane protein insertion porin family
MDVIGSQYERGRESYDESRTKGFLGFEKRYSDGWRRGIGFRLENVDVKDVDDDAPQEIKDVAGNNLITGVKFSLTKDKTDNRFNPTKGYIYDAEYEQVFGDFTFGVLTGGAKWYKTLYEDLAERKTVLETRIKAGTIIGDAPPFEKFYAGGIGSIRGFEYRGVSTRGLSTGPLPQKEDPIGSDWMILAGSEVSVPLGSETFAGLLFVDTGMIDTGGFRSSVGTGIQILIPQWFGPVPMRFEFAIPITKSEQDDTQVFSFSVGRLF